MLLLLRCLFLVSVSGDAAVAVSVSGAVAVAVSVSGFQKSLFYLGQ